ncbi:predicted protein [Postia placenta Mad-698-R]|uniref:Uncharacterized protein n=1 Tax=Postia placenta MAD-698-R-SB12 TaxID=670580 RepID=A0A1X6NID6_9APHY|nr:hypothetical protein POSPLADRAFT_1130309 [Postia placenta MAD-698-R-SB12]EED77221.1 predicted protein [Postia placenta Mad-698-R]OSX68206.1 hypothetical protein POSPLADRAFT_1130309 [Postia placenta MAD-698-R-SB12]
MNAKMNGLNILILDMFHTRAAEHPLRESTPALSDDTGSSSSRESSPPATPVSGLSRAPSISFEDNSKHILASDDTDIRIVEPDTDSSPPEDITRSLKRRRLADTRADGFHAERALLPDTSNDVTQADDGASFGLEHIPISDCTGVGDVKLDAVDLSLEYVFRSLKRKRCADTSTDDACAKRPRTSGTSSDVTKAEDCASFGLGHMLVRECTKIMVAEPDATPAVAPDISLHAPFEAIARPPKRKRCMITGCVSVEVEACYILPPDTPQPLTTPIPALYVSRDGLQPVSLVGMARPECKLHLMTTRVGREFMKQPLHYEHHLLKDALAHIPTITPIHPDVVEPVFSHIRRDSPVEGISRLPKRKRSPDTEAFEVPAKRMRTSGTARNVTKVEDGIPFGPHPRCMITGCVSADVEACYILPPDMPQLLVSRHDCYSGFCG